MLNMYKNSHQQSATCVFVGACADAPDQEWEDEVAVTCEQLQHCQEAQANLSASVQKLRVSARGTSASARDAATGAHAKASRQMRREVNTRDAQKVLDMRIPDSLRCKATTGLADMR